MPTSFKQSAVRQLYHNSGGGVGGAPQDWWDFCMEPAVWHKWGAPRIVLNRQTEQSAYQVSASARGSTLFIPPPPTPLFHNILFYLCRGEGRVTIVQVWLRRCHVYCFKQVLLWFGVTYNVLRGAPNTGHRSVDPSVLRLPCEGSERSEMFVFVRRYLSGEKGYKERLNMRRRTNNVKETSRWRRQNGQGRPVRIGN
jgi:hypothetical protein